MGKIKHLIYAPYARRIYDDIPLTVASMMLHFRYSGNLFLYKNIGNAFDKLFGISIIYHIKIYRTIHKDSIYGCSGCCQIQARLTVTRGIIIISISAVSRILRNVGYAFNCNPCRDSITIMDITISPSRYKITLGSLGYFLCESYWVRNGILEHRPSSLGFLQKDQRISNLIFCNRSINFLSPSSADLNF